MGINKSGTKSNKIGAEIGFETSFGAFKKGRTTARKKKSQG